MDGLDGAFLALESPTTHLHVAGVLVLDPGDGEVGFEQVRQAVARRVALVPPFRQRVVEVPFGLHHPSLVDDPDFDLDDHVLRCTVPAPGGPDELRAVVAELVSRPLDRCRPLWELHVVEGLAGGRLAVVPKLHHAIVDGLSGVDAMAAFFDLDPAGDPGVRPGPEPGAWNPGPLPDDGERLCHALTSWPEHVEVVAASVATTVLGVRALGERAERDGHPASPRPFAAPRTSINRAISPDRRVAFAALPLDDVRRVGRALGGTTNDVVLAAVAGALSSFFARRDEVVDGPLVAMVPISVRGEHQRGTLGNRVSATLVSLATDVEDPEVRFRTIVEGTRAAKDRHRVVGSELLAGWAEALFPAVTSPVAKLVARLRVFDHLPPLCNVVVSSVPGSPQPLYLAGAKLLSAHPLGPVVEGVGLNVTALSYEDRLDVGLLACRQLVSDVDVVAEGLAVSLGELVRVVGRGRAAARR